MTLSLAEAKRFSVVNEDYNPSYVTPVLYRYTVRNVFAPIPSGGSGGDSSYSREGAEIVDPLLKLKWTCRVNFGSNFPANYGTWYFHVYLIASIDLDTFPSTGVNVYPAIGGASDPGWFLNPDGARPTLNGNNVRVLKAWHRKYTPDQIAYGAATGVTPTVAGSVDITGGMSYRWRRKLTFQDSTSGAPNFTTSVYLRGMNYFILAGWSSSATTVPTASRPVFAMDSFLYWKDP